MMTAAVVSRRLMLVVSKKLPGVTIYDADNLQVLGRETMAVCPHEGTFSLDGRFAYIPLYGSSGVGKPGTDEHLLHIVRSSDCQIVASLDTGSYKRPHGMALGQSGILYVTAEIAESVILIDPQQPRIVGTIPTSSNTSHMIAIARDEQRAYVSNVRSKTVSVLDLPNRKLLKTIPTDSENQRMTLSPDEHWFVTSLGPKRKVAFFRITDDTLDFDIDVPGTPFVAKFSSDGKYLFSAGHQDAEIKTWTIDVDRRKIVAASGEYLGGDVGSLEMNPFTGDVCITDQATNRLSFLDPATLKIKQQLATDPAPDCIAFATVT